MHQAPFTTEATDGRARTGVLSLAHGDVPTPNFMPVGTRAVVKSLDTADLEDLGADMVLANTYHLMLRPGSDLIDRMGGLHGFTGWKKPMLTDSGGYQVFSLSPKLSEDGAVFKSTYDGSTVVLRPEDSMRVQQELGADVAAQTGQGAGGAAGGRPPPSPGSSISFARVSPCSMMPSIARSKARGLP